MPEGVSRAATRVDWGRASIRADPDHKSAAGRYGVISALTAAGVDSAHISVYYDEDDHGVYWVVDPRRGRSVVLTDDTESYAGWLEGPWPFVAIFRDAAGVVRTDVDLSLDTLLTRTIAWCTDR
ncbi:hypothetical protein [Saccharothrix espanaensis]|uniref:hypothetical protein n=1 Tax=Saccharothrix espanaensis TaxID=103731 RepID=UPI0002DCCA50|nr:hypothetical protein [Saccharothrix espanaensis]